MIDKTKIIALLRSSRSQKYARWFLLLFVAVGVFGFFALPPLLQPILIRHLSAELQRPVSIQNLRINPYALSAEIFGFVVKEPNGEGDFLSFDRLYLNLSSASLWRLGFVLKEIRLENPRVHLIREPSLRYNISDLLATAFAKPSSNKATPSFSLNNIQISGGLIELDDQPNGEVHQLSEIMLSAPFVSNMAYALDSFVEPSFSARLNGASVAFKGRTKLFADSLESQLLLEINALKLDKFIDYVPNDLPIKGLVGTLSSQLQISFNQTKDQAPSLRLSGDLSLADFALQDKKDSPLVNFKALSVRLGDSDVLTNRYVLDVLRLEQPKIYARVTTSGSLNWLLFLQDKLMSNDSTSSADTSAVAKPPISPVPPVYWALGKVEITDGTFYWLDASRAQALNARLEHITFTLNDLVSDSPEPARFAFSWQVVADEWLKIKEFAVSGGQINMAKQHIEIDTVRAAGVEALARRSAAGSIEWLTPPALKAVVTAQKSASKPWRFTLRQYIGEDIALRFEDRMTHPAAMTRVDKLSFNLENISSDLAEPVQLSLHARLNQQGELKVKGDVALSPLRVNVDIAAQELAVLPWQPYFADKLNVDIKRGQFSVDGHVQLAQDADNELSGGFSGQATLGDLHAVDKQNNTDFLRWKSLYVGKIDAQIKPRALRIGDVALSDFYARLILNAEGKLNLNQIVRSSADNTSLAATSEAVNAAPNAASASILSMPLKIDKITLQGGQVRFSDNFIKPNYSANLKAIGGRVSGLSSEAGSVADLELRGNYDSVAPLNIKAKLNPLLKNPYLDLQATIKGIELSPLSAYAGKYAGYAIEKGKLSLDLNYKIEGRRLRAENHLFLDQLTFGDAVDSPGASKLPISLAVALLKNRRGEIDIHLPIDGSLDDPEFSVSGLIADVFLNTLGKAVTSPFTLLSSMFGGSGEALSYAEFTPGRATLDAPTEERLNLLANALLDRPALKLEIEAIVSMDVDGEGLKQARLDRQVRLQKREDMRAQKQEPPIVNAIQITSAEYPDLLQRVYQETEFPKPRNFIGLQKSLPVAEMEKLILTNSIVEDDDLRALGERRSRVIRDALIARQVPAERLFLLPSKLQAPSENAENTAVIRKSRVSFALK